MKKEKTIDDKNLLRGVSTLDFAAKNLTQPILLLVFTMIFGGFIYAGAGHSILDSVDQDFNPQITTSSFGNKFVYSTEVLPDGKILAAGYFNSYNRQPVGGLIRLNADGSLDTTFNNNLIATNVQRSYIMLQPDGKIILYGSSIVVNNQTSAAKSLIRLNSDGTLDASFNFTAGGSITSAAIDAAGRILVVRAASIAGDGAAVIRLNSDGSPDSAFSFASTETLSGAVVAAQNNKVIVFLRGQRAAFKRLNEDGSVDASFSATVRDFSIIKMIVQPDNKILVLDSRYLRRLNENGDADAGFREIDFFNAATNLSAYQMRLAGDGRITVVTTSINGFIFQRFLPDGASDSSFSPYRHMQTGSFALQANGSVIIGDDFMGGAAPGRNAFVRLLPNGSLDTSFNPGGIGFQTMEFGSVWAITLQTDGKILIGGEFDEVNNLPRPKLARLNSDSTVDASFQINTSGAGNYFSQITNVYNITQLPDGKLMVTGNFFYLLGGVQKANVVRLNADGSIDATFNLSIVIDDTFSSSGGGKNRFISLNDGKIIVGASRGNISERAVPIRLNSDGSLDNTFNPTIFSNINTVIITDVAVQPDGKILIGGRYEIPNITGDVSKSFIARLNADGSTDQTFQVNEELNKQISTFKLLQDGKILIAKLDFPLSVGQPTKLFRLNSDGSNDNSFNAGTGAGGKTNALLILPSGKIMVGGKFTIFNGQPRGNLALLNADGSLDPITYNVNQEVLCLTLDGQGRVLVGGGFTSISAGGGQNHARSYVARLVDSSQAAERTRFDFDGDGKADLAVFTASSGNWSVRASRANQTSNAQFGQIGDKTAAADFDNDGKTDLAVYRPSEGSWYLMQSTAGFKAVRWGVSEDKPVPADYDGDGRADVAVWRPSNGVWYILQSSNDKLSAVQFGQLGDIALSDADFDDDGRTDIAVFRPSSGTFYWLASGAIGNQFRAVQFGQSGDIPAVGDFNGDGKSDLVVFRPSNGVWYQYLTTQNAGYTFAAMQFGQNGDEPVAADYNGDGKADIAVRRQGVWHLLMSGQGYAGVAFGNANTQAIAALQERNNSPCGGVTIPCPPGCVCTQ